MKDGYDVSAAELRQILDYDPETGVLTWKPRHVEMFRGGKYPADRLAASWNAKHAGKPALTADTGHGYLHGSIFDRLHRAHRVCWAIYHGKWPAGQIDHINGDRSDNRISNMRDVSHGENGKNQKLRATNTSGAMGVYMDRRSGRWGAYIKSDDGRKYLGAFQDFDAAVSARKAAERELGYSPNHGRTA